MTINWDDVIKAAAAAIAPTVVALGAWRSSRGNRTGIANVHILVNSQRAGMLKEIAALKITVNELRVRLGMEPLE